jgi:hypothetical protein
MNKLICTFDGNVMKTIVVYINVHKCYMNKFNWRDDNGQTWC